VLRHCSAKALWQQKQRQSLLEELNTLYVAFTRGKTSLHVCFAYQGQKTWDEYYADKQGDMLKLPTILANACMDYFAGELPDEDGILRIQSKYPELKDQAPDDQDVRLELSLAETALAEEQGLNWESTMAVMEDNIRDWKAVYLDKRQHLYGDLVHYYLSFIRQDTSSEHRFAALQCINRYGSLLPIETLNSVFEDTRSELHKHSYLFDPDYDKVFTELPIGKLRIDRVMVNSGSKEALVIDFKTGGIYEEEQLENYVDALKRTPAFKDYRFSSKYVNLEISG